MNRKKRTILERNIIACLEAYRYKTEIEIIESELKHGEKDENNSGKEKKSLTKFVKSLFETASSAIKKPINEKELEQAKTNHALFTSSLPEGVSISMLEDLQSFKSTIEDYFRGNGQSAKIGMALEIIGNEQDPSFPTLLRPSQSRKAISALLFGDEDSLNEINGFFQNAYDEIGSPKPNGFSRGFLYGLAVGSVAMLGPRIITKLFGIKTDGAPIKKLLAGSAQALAASELLMLSTLVGGGYITKRDYRRKARKMRAVIMASLDNEIAYSFAAAITLWEYGTKGSNIDERKGNLDLILKMIDDIRSDAQYLALVEGEQREANLNKILVCNNAIAFLASIHH